MHIMAVWDERYAELVEFQERFGHCNVPQHWKENSKLGLWVRDQRVARKKGKLPHEKYYLLDKLGFVWIAKATRNPQAKWDERYSELLKFKSKHGHVNVPANSIEYSTLARWVNHQRTIYKNGTLLKSREELLTTIGFNWGKRVMKPKSFEQYYQDLVQFKTIHGHCWVKMNDPSQQDLSRWMAAIRAKKLAGQLSFDRFSKLAELGFSWFKLNTSKTEKSFADWPNMIRLLELHKERFGNCDFKTNRPSSPDLEIWAKKIRYLMPAGELSIDRQVQLNQIGFVWVHDEAELQELFENKFRSKAKNRPVSLVPVLDEFTKMKKLAADEWNVSFQKLCSYKKEHGSLAGLSKDTEARALFKWFQQQKVLFRQDELDKEKLQALKVFGFLGDLSIQGRGGKRPGAGRKKGSGTGRKAITRLLYLPTEVWKRLDDLRGSSSPSAFIKQLLDSTSEKQTL
jgi:hypothetical protein